MNNNNFNKNNKIITLSKYLKKNIQNINTNNNLTNIFLTIINLIQNQSILYKNNNNNNNNLLLNQFLNIFTEKYIFKKNINKNTISYEPLPFSIMEIQIFGFQKEDEINEKEINNII